MDSHLWFQQLHKALQEHRVPTKYASRFKEELWLHYLEMAERDEVNGFTETESHIFERLGSPESLAAQAAQVPRSTWAGRHPWLAFVVGAPVIALGLVFGTFMVIPFGEGTSVALGSWFGPLMIALGPLQVIASVIIACLLMLRMVRRSGRSPWWGVASCGLIAIVCATIVIKWEPPNPIPGSGMIMIGLAPVAETWYQMLVPIVIGFVYASWNLPTRKPQSNDMSCKGGSLSGKVVANQSVSYTTPQSSLFLVSCNAMTCYFSIAAILTVVCFNRSFAFAQDIRSVTGPIDFPVVGPIRGSEELLKAPATILVGEMHGTWESPLLVASLVRSALSKEAPTILCIELESSEQESLDQFMQSNGGVNAVATLLKSPHWSITDGRASTGMFAMIELMRRLIKQGNDVRLIAIDLDIPKILLKNFDPKDIDPKLIEEYQRLSEKRDQVLAENVVAAWNNFPMSHVFVLTGNIHTKFTKGLPWDGGYKPMGWYILEQIPSALCLDFQCSGGRAWQATDHGVGPTRLDGIKRGDSPFVELFDNPKGGYHGLLYVGNATVAEPKVSSLKKARDLRSELLRRRDIDQESREALIQWEKEHAPLPSLKSTNSQEAKAEFENLLNKMPLEYRQLNRRLNDIDIENTAWMKAVIKEHGWPTADMVGKDGAAAAWLLVQHADEDTAFQRQCLDTMTQLPKNAVSQQDLAYLTDRVLLAEGKTQLYGTQFTKVDGKLTLRPVEDESQLDSRRSAMGLPPMAEQLKMIKDLYGPSMDATKEK